MAENQGNSNSNVIPGTSRGGGGNNANVHNPLVVADHAAQNAAVQLAQQILNNINITLKKEVIKLPGFYGQSNKDTIFAMDLISRIDKCQISNDWNDIATYSNFWLCLHGEAKE